MSRPRWLGPPWAGSARRGPSGPGHGPAPAAVPAGHAGVLVDPNTPNALVVNLEKLINNRNEAQRLGRNAKERFEKNYTKSTYEEKWINTITKIISRN